MLHGSAIHMILVLDLHRSCVLCSADVRTLYRSLCGTSDSRPRGRWHENTEFPMHADRGDDVIRGRTARRRTAGIGK